MGTWELRDTCRERLIAVSPRGGYSSDLKNQRVQVWDKPLTDGLFEFTIKDSNGDGLCCSQGEGGYEIYYALDGFPGPTITSKMEGVSEEKQYFGLEEHCPQYPDPDEPDKPVCRSASSFEKIALSRGRTKSYDLMKRYMNKSAGGSCYDFLNHECKCCRIGARKSLVMSLRVVSGR